MGQWKSVAEALTEDERTYVAMERRRRRHGEHQQPAQRP
jgi:hypothetical protein